MNPETIKRGVYVYLDAILSKCLVMTYYDAMIIAYGPELFADPSYTKEELYDAKNQIVFYNEEQKFSEISFEPVYDNRTSVSMRSMLVDNITSAMGVERKEIVPYVESWALELFKFIEFPLHGKVSDLIKKRKGIKENRNITMKKTIKLTESQLVELINAKIQEQKTGNYMFFSNLKQMRRQIDKLLSVEPQMIEDILQNGHDWADDHITTATENLDQVFDFMMNEEDDEFVVGPLDEETKREPTNKKLWSKAKSLAKSKYKVWPSAYASGWAAKWYKKQGGGWRNK